MSKIQSNFLETQPAFKNKLINGHPIYIQRTGGTYTNDKYGFDRYNILSEQATGVTIAQSTDAPTGFLYSQSLLQADTIAGKFGTVQIIENLNCYSLVGDVASLSFYAKGTGITSIKAAVLSWNSTADSVTSDVVATWGVDGVTPTWATNWTAENIPTAITIDGTWQRFEIPNISIDTANTTNVAVVVWTDNQEAQNNVLFLSGMQLEQGSTVSNFEHRAQLTEANLCYRYYWRKTAATNETYFAITAVYHAGNGYHHGLIWYPVKMRTAPVVTFSTANNTVDHHFYVLDGVGSGLYPNLAAVNVRDDSFVIYMIQGTATSSNYVLGIAGAWAGVDGEL